MRQLLGKGVLSWLARERRSDRYGSVMLMEEGSNSLMRTDRPININFDVLPREGSIGSLMAVVTRSRCSTHIGDLFHGVFPSTPKLGEEIVLGKGALFYAVNEYGYTDFGLIPEDGRKGMWLDIHALYRAHEQSVELYFEEEDNGQS